MDKQPFPSKSNNAPSGLEAGKWAKGAMLRLIMIWARSTVELLMIIALGFVIVSWSSFRDGSPDSAMVLYPQVTDHDRTDSGIIVRTTLDLDHSSFVRGTCNVIILDPDAQRYTPDLCPRNPPLSADAAARRYEHAVTIPLLGLLLLAVLVLLVIISLRARDYVYLCEFWITHLTLLHPKKPMNS